MNSTTRIILTQQAIGQHNGHEITTGDLPAVACMAAPLSCSAGHPSWCAWRMDVSAVEKGEEGSLLFLLYRSHFQLNEHESLNTWGTVSPCLFCWQALVLLIIGQQVNFSTQSEAFPHLQEVPYLSSSSQYCILCASVLPTSIFWVSASPRTFFGPSTLRP